MFRYILLVSVFTLPICGMEIDQKLSTISPIITPADDDKQDVLLQADTAYKNYPKLIECYKKYYFTTDFDQPKVPHTTVQRNNTWDTATKKIQRFDKSNDTLETLLTKNPELTWAFSFRKKGKGKVTKKISRKKTRKPSPYYNYVNIAHSYHHQQDKRKYMGITMGTLIFDHHVNYIAFSPDQTKLIALESLDSPTQTEYDLTPLLADINSIDAALLKDSYKLASFIREANPDNTTECKAREETAIKKYMDLLFDKKNLPSAKRQKIS